MLSVALWEAEVWLAISNRKAALKIKLMKLLLSPVVWTYPQLLAIYYQLIQNLCPAYPQWLVGNSVAKPITGVTSGRATVFRHYCV